MNKNRERVIGGINNLIEARDIIFSQIVNFAMLNGFSHIDDAFDVGDVYSFTLAQFEDMQDVNVQHLVRLCKGIEETIFTLMDLNGIKSEEVNLEGNE